MPVEEIKGYREFIRATDKIERNLPDSLREASVQIARDLVSAASANASTSQANLAAQSLGVNDDPEGASVTNGSPLFFGSEFGGQGRPETMHFPPHNGRRGYWFYPALRENAERFEALWDKGVEAAMIPWDN
jgi:hypothetical protein